MDVGQIAGGWFGLVLIVLGLIIAVLWILLPFAVIGIKSRLDEINTTNMAMLNELKRLNNRDRGAPPRPVATSEQHCPNCGTVNPPARTSCKNCNQMLPIEPKI